jgi:hypothetical protein
MKRIALVLFFLAPACAERLPLVGAPCPCAETTVCDTATNTCVSMGGPGDGATVLDALPGPEPEADAAPIADGSASAEMSPCEAIGLHGAADVEFKYIPQRCGQAMCHGPSSVFPPRNLHMPARIRASLIDQPSLLNCKQDLYVDRANPARSTFLATVEAVSDTVTCPSGGQGGTRMPNKDMMPTIPGMRLPQAEIECLRWWVSQIVK